MAFCLRRGLARPRLYQRMYHGYERRNILAEKVFNAVHPLKKCTSLVPFHLSLVVQIVPRKQLHQQIDVSRSAQLRDIEASFSACNEPSQFDLATLRHPNKPGITAVESFEILPDADIWANAYDLFRFSERPGDKPIDVSGCLSPASVLLIELNIGGRP